jgi:hypothetical protein
VANEGVEGESLQQSRETVFTVENRIYGDPLSGEPMMGANPFTFIKRLWRSPKEQNTLPDDPDKEKRLRLASGAEFTRLGQTTL